MVTSAQRVFLIILALAAASAEARTPKIYTYVGRITPRSFLLAWGTADGDGNTIGRESKTLGAAIVTVNNRLFPSEKTNWVEVTGLAPDTTYAYRVSIAGRTVANGQVRTFPESAERLSFFVIGDFGTGKSPQYEIARAMFRKLEEKRSSDNPVRFVVTTGDNIYSDRILGLFLTNKGDKDRDWKTKFFEPYEAMLKEIPFYPAVGNHDRRGTSDSDHSLSTLLDNFFLPANEPSPYYTFSFGGLVDLVALDSTAIWDNPKATSLTKDGGQFLWLQETLRRKTAPWRIAYFHHSPFSAGPNHEPSLGQLAHIVDQFKETGLQVVFSGHEHNFQFTSQNDATGRTLYVVSGAGGQLRSGNIYSAMQGAGIAGTAPQHHFLLVEIESDTLTITPLSSDPVVARDAYRRPIVMPIVVKRTR